MSAQHTPGPWNISLWFGRSFNGATIHSGGFAVVSMPRRADRPYGQKEADARLIAAAPDLLAALKSLVYAVDDERRAAAEAAIAKAEGRS